MIVTASLCVVPNARKLGWWTSEAPNVSARHPKSPNVQVSDMNKTAKLCVATIANRTTWLISRLQNANVHLQNSQLLDMPMTVSPYVVERAKQTT
jgi:hypothetical protein